MYGSLGACLCTSGHFCSIDSHSATPGVIRNKCQSIAKIPRRLLFVICYTASAGNSFDATHQRRRVNVVLGGIAVVVQTDSLISTHFFAAWSLCYLTVTFLPSV